MPVVDNSEVNHLELSDPPPLPPRCVTSCVDVYQLDLKLVDNVI